MGNNSMTGDAIKTNRKYKSSLFADYFENTERLIEAYNAIAGTDYPPDTEIEFKTLVNVFTDSILNDIAFTIEGRYVVLIEQQLCKALHNWCYVKKMIMQS